MMKWGALANPDARRRLAKTALSGIAADKAAGTVYDIINQSINVLLFQLNLFGMTLLRITSLSIQKPWIQFQP
jgi:hypothetical protein